MSRVAWILYGGLEARTGGTIYDAIVVAGLRARGIDVDVVAIAPGAPAEPLLERLVEADVVVGDELCFREIAALFPRIPCGRVLLVHHLTCWEDGRADVRDVELAALASADVVVTTSRTTRDRLRVEGYERAVDVIVPGSDRLDALPRAPAERVTFLFVGSVTPRKRVRELVHAFCTLPEDCALRIVGSRAHDPAYAADVAAVASRDVTFVGEVEEPALARELAAAHALVMPSSLEGYGMAATEAIAAGVPVIATRAPGLTEALASCTGAVLFADIGELAVAMRALAGDAPLRERMAIAARHAEMPRWSETIGAFAAVTTRATTR